MRAVFIPAFLATACGCAGLDGGEEKRLAGCAASDRYTLRVGMPETVMLACSFGGYTPYVSARRVGPAGEVKVYEGMGRPRAVYVGNGQVVGWDG